MNKLNKITTIEIETRLAGYFNYRQNIIVPNISWGLNLHECDLLVLRKSGYATEIEIKISKSDLKADLKKGHNHTDKANRISELYFAIPDYMIDCVYLIPEDAGILILKRNQYYHHFNFLEVKRLRKAKINKNRSKFCDNEILKLAHLGTMRIWKLKQNIIETKRKILGVQQSIDF
jgi:hypothetical protein